MLRTHIILFAVFLLVIVLLDTCFFTLLSVFFPWLFSSDFISLSHWLQRLSECDSSSYVWSLISWNPFCMFHRWWTIYNGVIYICLILIYELLVENSNENNNNPLSGIQNAFSNLNILNGTNKNPLESLFSGNGANGAKIFLVTTQGIVMPMDTLVKGFANMFQALPNFAGQGLPSMPGLQNLPLPQFGQTTRN